jgi:phospholipase C
MRSVSRASSLAGLVLGGALLAGCASGGGSESTGEVAQAVTLGANLIANGDAESGPGITSSNQTVTIPGWSVTGGTPVAIQYGASGGFPDASTPGPSNRGVNFFGGGNDASASLTQTIDVSGNAAQIDAGSIHYDLNGWLGGWSSQNDQCNLKVTFLNSSNSSVGSAQIGPVTNSNRGNVTEFLQRDAAGAVPSGTRSLKVVLTFTRHAGTFNDGYADDLSLVLTQTGQDAGADAGGGGDAAPDQGSDAPGDATHDGSVADAGSDTSTSDAGDAGSDGGACSTPIPPDPYASQRQACTFTTGASVTSTLPLTAAQQAAIPVKHVIVLMKENRAFDHLVGHLHDQGQPNTEAIPASFSNKDLGGVTVAPFHEPTTCVQNDPGHQWNEMHNQVNGGAMDGFVTSAANTTGTDGHFVMGNYQQSDLPFYYWLASTYAINDRHFASVRSGTFPNRDFLLLGTADGVTCTGCGYPSPSTPTIFDSMDTAGVTWGVYSDGSLLSGTLNWTSSHVGAHNFASFLSALDGGTLPAVSFVDGIDNVEDEHPTANVQQGEAWTRNIYEHAVASPLWSSIAILWTYDEAGGFADHVPPPNNACIARPVSQDQNFYELGVRIPMAVISPYSRPGYVSHVVQEHTAITRFIQTVFNLPALTARDANSDALLDLLDFGCPPAFLTPPAAPASGTGGCGGSITMSTDKPIYHQGDSILVSWQNAPGNNGLDWIGIYPYGTLPHSGSTLWEYIDGSHKAGASPASGTVTINSSSLGVGPWPLPVGSWTAWYLLNDGYTGAASIEFTVQ